MAVQHQRLQANPTPALPHRGRGLFGWRFDTDGMQANPTPALPHRGRGLFGWRFDIDGMQANPTPALPHWGGGSFVAGAVFRFTYTTSA